MLGNIQTAGIVIDSGVLVSGTSLHTSMCVYTYIAGT